MCSQYIFFTLLVLIFIYFNQKFVYCHSYSVCSQFLNYERRFEGPKPLALVSHSTPQRSGSVQAAPVEGNKSRKMDSGLSWFSSYIGETDIAGEFLLIYI